MDFKKLTDKAKQVVDNRGGVDSLKEDAEQLRDIAKGGGSIKDKAKDAVAAIKDPGDGPEVAGTAADPTAQDAPVASPAPPPPASEPGAAPQDPVADDLGDGGHGRGADDQV